MYQSVTAMPEIPRPPRPLEPFGARVPLQSSSIIPQYTYANASGPLPTSPTISSPSSLSPYQLQLGASEISEGNDFDILAMLRILVTMLITLVATQGVMGYHMPYTVYEHAHPSLYQESSLPRSNWDVPSSSGYLFPLRYRGLPSGQATATGGLSPESQIQPTHTASVPSRTTSPYLLGLRTATWATASSPAAGPRPAYTVATSRVSQRADRRSSGLASELPEQRPNIHPTSPSSGPPTRASQSPFSTSPMRSPYPSWSTIRTASAGRTDLKTSEGRFLISSLEDSILTLMEANLTLQRNRNKEAEGDDGLLCMILIDCNRGSAANQIRTSCFNIICKILKKTQDQFFPPLLLSSLGM